MTLSFVAKTAIVVAALSLIPSWARAEGKPRKPAVFAEDACQLVTTKDGSKVELCQASEKSRPRVLREFARVTMPDGSSWIVGR